MASSKYIIAEDSPVTRASVDDKRLALGDDPIDLTQDQVSRVEDTGVKLSKSTGSPGGSNDN
jgi:hypothetical protein